jgi:hypothetical protein
MPVTATCGSHTELALATLGSATQIGSFLLAKASKEAGSTITNGREPCLGRVFNFKLGIFTWNTKNAQHVNDQI